MEGEKGIEVYEMMQFGAKIGMNDQGEFINQVPEKYYLFFQYRMADGKYTPFAKIVDKTGLDKLLSMAEVTMSEDCAYDKVTRSQRAANRDPMFKNDADGSESTKKAVATTQRKKERKLANGSLDDKEYDPEYVQGIKEELDGEGYETNNQLPDFDEEVRVTKWSDNSHTARVSKDGKVLGVHTRKKHSDLNKEIKSRFGLKGNIPQGEAPGKAKTHKIDEATSDTPEESAMVRTELRAMIDKANALLKALKTDKHVEPWVQSKVANAKGMLSGVHDYMLYGEGDLNEQDEDPRGEKEKHDNEEEDIGENRLNELKK